jgi:hypothetical protein
MSRLPSEIVDVKYFSENKQNKCTMELYPTDIHRPSSMYGPNMVNLGCMVMTCTVHHQCMDQIW